MTRPCCLRCPRLGLIVLDEGETHEIDSEDMECAFNLFRMPPVWKSFFAFAKKVPCSVCPGGDPNKWAHVAITTVPMGWVGAVDLIQHIARRPTAWFAWIARMWLVRQTLQPTLRPRLSNRFRPACDRLKLPLHAGKRVVRASSAPILGAELDGAHGILRHARD